MLAIALSVSALTFAQERPNIITILIDDQDLNEISAYDGADVYTPNMDRLAKEGIKFNQAYVSSTVCTPSRYSFLTGRYAGNSYSNMYKQEVGESKQGAPGFNVALENDKMNVATVLKSAGYITGFTGKYHLTSEYDQPDLFTPQSGFIGGFGKERKKDKSVKPGKKVSGEFAQSEKWGRKYLKYMGFDWAKNIYEGNMNKPYDKHNPEWTMRAAYEFLETYKDQAFFLQICPTLLHGPDKQWRTSKDFPDYTAAGEIKADPKILKKRNQLWQSLKDKGFDPSEGAVWGAAWIDMCVGQLLDKLDEMGLSENTLVIFVPDHGSSDKASLYSYNGTHVPLVMRWPKGIKAGIECDLLVQNIDFAPTYFELAGAILPKGYKIDGLSMVPLLKTGKAKDWRDYLYFELGTSRAILKDDWKYIVNRYTEEDVTKMQTADFEELALLMTPLKRLGIGVRGASHPGFWEQNQLYKLDEDPKEMNNLVAEAAHRKKIKELQTLLANELKKVGRPYGEFYKEGNANVESEIVEKYISIVKQLDIKGKKVTVPEHLK